MARKSFWRLHRVKLVASAVITAGVLYTLQRGGLKVWPDGVSFARVRWWTVPIYLLTLLVFTYYRAVRWRFLLRSTADVPKRRLLSVSWIGFAAILLMPFRIGEIVRPYLIQEKGKISLATATGTIVAERVVDGLYLSVVLAVALLFAPTIEPLPRAVVGLHIPVADVRYAGFMMLGVFALAFAVIAVFYRARDWASRVTLAVVGIVSKSLAVKLASMAGKLADGLHFFGRAGDAVPFMIETTFYWGANVLGMWLLAWGCHIHHLDGTSITFGEACALMGMLGITLLIPGPPGLIGVFQAGIYAGMTMYFPTSVVVNEGAAYVFLLYALQVVWTILSALACMALDPSSLRLIEEAETFVAGMEKSNAEVA